MKTKVYLASGLLLSSLFIPETQAQQTPWLTSLGQAAAGSFVGFGVTRLLYTLYPMDSGVKKSELESLLNKTITDINATTGEIVVANDLKQLNGEVSSMVSRLPPRVPVNRNFENAMDDLKESVNSDLALIGKLNTFGPAGSMPMRVAGAHVIGRQEMLTNLWRVHLGHAVVMGQSKPGGRSNEDSIRANIKAVRDSEIKLMQQLVANMTKTKDHFHIWKSEGRYAEKTKLEMAATLTADHIDHGPFKNNTDYSCVYRCQAKLTFSPTMAWTSEGDGAYRGKIAFETGVREMGTRFMGQKQINTGGMDCRVQQPAFTSMCLKTSDSADPIQAGFGNPLYSSGLAYLNGAHSPLWGDINQALSNLASKFLGEGWESQFNTMNERIKHPYQYDAMAAADRNQAAKDTCTWVGYAGGIPVGKFPQGYYCYNQIKSFPIARVQDALRVCKENGFPTGYGTDLPTGKRANCVKQ